MRYRYWISLAAAVVLAVVFLTAGVGKLMGQSAFLLNVSSFVLNERLAGAIASWLPWVELVLGAVLLIGFTPQLAGGVATVLVGAFIFHNTWMVSHGWGYQPCGCLGVLDKLFQGKLSTVGSLYLDIGLFALALTVYFAYPGRLLNTRPWFLGRGKAATPKEDGVAGDKPK